VKDPIGLHSLDELLDRALVPKVTFQKLNARLDVPDVFGPASPPHGAIDLDLGMLRQNVFREVTAGKPGDPRYQDSQEAPPFQPPLK
jgi:hypothetical protein